MNISMHSREKAIPILVGVGKKGGEKKNFSKDPTKLGFSGEDPSATSNRPGSIEKKKKKTFSCNLALRGYNFYFGPKNNFKYFPKIFLHLLAAWVVFKTFLCTYVLISQCFEGRFLKYFVFFLQFIFCAFHPLWKLPLKVSHLSPELWHSKVQILKKNMERIFKVRTFLVVIRGYYYLFFKTCYLTI